MKVLLIEGTTLGTIVALTSPLSWDVSKRSEVLVLSTAPASSRRSCTGYYGSRRNIARALVRLILSRKALRPFTPNNRTEVFSDIIKHIFLWYSQFESSQVAKCNDRNPCSVFYSWSHGNDAFKISEKAISDSLQLRYCPKTFYTFIAFTLVLLSFGPIGGALLNVEFKSAFVLLSLCGVYTSLLVVAIATSLSDRATDLQRLLSERIDQSKRVFVLDRGLVGITCADTKIGDRICLIAGCAKAVVLRQRRNHEVLQHYVIGSADVHLNHDEDKKYQPLFDYRHYVNPEDQERMRGLLNTYRGQQWWTQYSLV